MNLGDMDFLSFEDELAAREEEEEEIILVRESPVEEASFLQRKRKQEIDQEDINTKKGRSVQSEQAGAIVEASRTGDFQAMQKLVEEGGNVNEKVCGCTALMYAAFYGRDEMAEFLLKLGANVNDSNLSNQTALLWAIERQNFSTIRILLKHKADASICDKKGLTALHKAVRAGCLDSVKLLVESDSVDVNLPASKELDCCTALQDACFYGDTEIVQYLLEHDANIEQQNSQSRTALHRAVYKNHAKIAQLLLDCGASIDAQENTERTALHWAAFFGHLESFKVLLENGADLDIKDKAGLTAEEIATNRKHWGIVDQIKEWKQQNNLP